MIRFQEGHAVKQTTGIGREPTGSFSAFAANLRPSALANLSVVGP